MGRREEEVSERKEKTQWLIKIFWLFFYSSPDIFFLSLLTAFYLVGIYCFFFSPRRFMCRIAICSLQPV